MPHQIIQSIIDSHGLTAQTHSAGYEAGYAAGIKIGGSQMRLGLYSLIRDLCYSLADVSFTYVPEAAVSFAKNQALIVRAEKLLDLTAQQTGGAQ